MSDIHFQSCQSVFVFHLRSWFRYMRSMVWPSDFWTPNPCKGNRRQKHGNRNFFQQIGANSFRRTAHSGVPLVQVYCSFRRTAACKTRHIQRRPLRKTNPNDCWKMIAAITLYNCITVALQIIYKDHQITSKNMWNPYRLYLLLGTASFPIRLTRTTSNNLANNAASSTAKFCPSILHSSKTWIQRYPKAMHKRQIIPNGICNHRSAVWITGASRKYDLEIPWGVCLVCIKDHNFLEASKFCASSDLHAIRSSTHQFIKLFLYSTWYIVTHCARPFQMIRCVIFLGRPTERPWKFLCTSRDLQGSNGVLQRCSFAATCTALHSIAQRHRTEINSKAQPFSHTHSWPQLGLLHISWLWALSTLIKDSSQHSSTLSQCSGTCNMSRNLLRKWLFCIWCHLTGKVCWLYLAITYHVGSLALHYRRMSQGAF